MMFQYAIRPGDTLYGIAAQFNVPMEAILAANPGLYPYNLLVGQIIMIPTTYYPRYPSYPVYPPFPVPRAPRYSERREEPFPVPRTPSAPGAPGTQRMPGMQGMPGASSMPGTPGTQAAPGTQRPSETPGM